MKKIVNKQLWIEKNEDGYKIGLTKEGQEDLGNIMFVELPEEGQVININEPLLGVEAAKAVTELTSPLSARIESINPALKENPNILNSDVEADTWIAKLSDVSEEDFVKL